MKNPLLDWVLLIPWALCNFLLLSHGFENRFRSRGASLLLSRPVEVQPPAYYYYDPVEPVNVRQRRQRQFTADLDPAPIVTVLNTGRASEATVQIKELPPLSRPPSSHFAHPFTTSAPIRPPPVTPQQHTTSTSFARFNQFGHDLFSLATSPVPPNLPESRFSPPLDRLTGAPVSSAVPTLAPPSFPDVHSISPRTLFGGFSTASRGEPETTTTSSTTSASSTTASTASTTAFHQRPLVPFSSSTTRFLRPRTSLGSTASFERSTSTTTTLRPQLDVEDDFDPCLEENHIVITNEPQRSANHHLSLGAIGESPICDRTILQGWYRFDSPAGNLIPTECPGENYCGTRKPVWLNGSHPTVSDGIVKAVGCVVESSEDCCGTQLNLAVKNCSSHMVYFLEPPPACSIGYCAGHRLPCPEGLTSPSGFTPCEFPVKLREVHLKPNKVPSNSENDLSTSEEIVFYCFPMLDGIVDPHTVVVDVEWWVEDRLVIEESFNLNAKSEGTLQPQFWSMGQTVRCSARARHVTIGTKTEKMFSNSFFAGIKITSPSIVRIQPGEQIEEVRIKPTVMPLCSYPISSRFFASSHQHQKCCLEIEFNLSPDDDDTCSNMGLTINLPTCQMQVCSDSWNQTLVIPLASSGKNDHHSNEIKYTLTPVVKSNHRQWAGYELPAIKILLAPSSVEKYMTCALSASTSLLEPFSGLQKFNLTSPMAVYSLYKRTTGGSDIEVQALMKHCNLRPNCLCALAVRSKSMAVYFDRCTKGFLQVWAKESIQDVHIHGIDVISRLEGRMYEVQLPDGAILNVDPLLTQVHIISKHSQVASANGLCQDQDESCQGPQCLFNQWRVKPLQSLFNGVVKMSANMTNNATTSKSEGSQCQLRPSSLLSENCASEEKDESKESILDNLTRLGVNEDFAPYTALISTADEENAVKEEPNSSNANLLPTGLRSAVNNPPRIRPPSLSEISFSEGPSKEPEEGWTSSVATSYCADYIASSAAAKLCKPFVATSRYTDSCQADLLFSGNSRIASLHLKNLKEDCRQVIQTDKSLELTTDDKEEILDSLCLSSCSGHGTCQDGFCKCDRGYGGADCGLDLTLGPHVTALDNLGLCDVRTKPCRDVVVIAEQLATKSGEELKCVIEIYKIRGVASKQLVNDAVVSVSGRPLSYEQVLCRLPKLEIHEPSEDFITNFDLKDNTDQTQLLVKISLEYSQNGGRSAPLDLLLYDSLCWDCKIDGCQANTKENKCFFASGTSALQIFRIGRTIATRVSPDDAYTCTLPKDSGSCDNKIFRYYYNAIERRCKLFVYGGCKGNGNNFVSEILCLQKCGDESDLALLPQVEVTTEIDTCSQKRDAGICPGNVPRFYYDKKLERCQLFSYGGCGGNTNNFETLDECVSHCGGPREAAFQISDLEGSLKPRKSHCNLPVSKGNCQAKLRRFFFDPNEGICKLFIFGGCQGNQNNFETMEECIINCSGPDTQDPDEDEEEQLSLLESFSSRLQRFKTKFQNRHRGSSPQSTVPGVQIFSNTQKPATSTESTIFSLPPSSLPLKSNVCELPKDFGTCLTDSIRYYHDPETNSCKKFRYSGCGGNGNNFLQGEECVRTCGGLLDMSSIEPPPTVIRNNLFPKPSSTTTTTTTTEPTTTSTTTTTVTTTVTTTTSSPITTAAEVAENEIIRSRPLLSRSQPLQLELPQSASLRDRRMKVRVVHKKRPFSIEDLTDEEVEEEAANTTVRPPIRRQRVRPRVLPAESQQIEVRTEKSIRTATSKSVIMTSNALFAKRNGLLLGNETRIDQVLEAPPSMGGNALVVIRGFCRKAPMVSDDPHCFRPEPLYFYNVTSASCEPFFKGHCARSRNKFESVQDCQDQCIIDGSEVTDSKTASTLSAPSEPPRVSGSSFSSSSFRKRRGRLF